MNKTKLILSLFVLSAATPVFAQDGLFPNNTDSRVLQRLANSGPSGGIVEIRNAYFYRHLYGYYLMIDLLVVNQSYRKEIRVHAVDHTGRILQTQVAKFEPSDGPGHRPAAPFARYQGKMSNAFDRFQVATHSLAARGRYIVEVRMDGVSYWSGYVTVGASSRL